MQAFDCSGTQVGTISLRNNFRNTITTLAKLNNSASYALSEVQNTLFTSDGFFDSLCTIHSHINFKDRHSSLFRFRHNQTEILTWHISSLPLLCTLHSLLTRLSYKPCPLVCSSICNVSLTDLFYFYLRINFPFAHSRIPLWSDISPDSSNFCRKKLDCLFIRHQFYWQSNFHLSKYGQLGFAENSLKIFFCIFFFPRNYQSHFCLQPHYF